MSRYQRAGKAPPTMKETSITSIVKQRKCNGSVQSAFPARPCRNPAPLLSVVPHPLPYRRLQVVQILLHTALLAGAGGMMPRQPLNQTAAAGAPPSAHGTWGPATAHGTWGPAMMSTSSDAGAPIVDIALVTEVRVVTGALPWSMRMASFGSVTTVPAIVCGYSCEQSEMLEMDDSYCSPGNDCWRSSVERCEGGPCRMS